MEASTPTFGELSFSQEEKTEIRNLLGQKLNKDEITYRQGPSGQKIPYLETWKAIELSNDIFGYNGWSSSVINLSQDFIEEVNGRVTCGVSAVVRIQLKDGTYHEDVGYGICEGQKSKGAALEKAKKEAVSDALKRALRLFGNHLGNSVYDKEHLKNVKNAPITPAPSRGLTTAGAAGAAAQPLGYQQQQQQQQQLPQGLRAGIGPNSPPFPAHGPNPPSALYHAPLPQAQIQTQQQPPLSHPGTNNYSNVNQQRPNPFNPHQNGSNNNSNSNSTAPTLPSNMNFGVPPF